MKRTFDLPLLHLPSSSPWKEADVLASHCSLNIAGRDFFLEQRSPGGAVVLASCAALNVGGGLWSEVPSLVRAEVLGMEVTHVRPLPGCEGVLEVAVSGQLQMPAHSSALPCSTILARSVSRLVQYVTSLAAQPEASDVSESTTMTGVVLDDATSADKEAGSVGGEEGDVRNVIYDLLRPTEWSAEATEPPGLTCTLRGYQRRALAWMAHRESAPAGSSSEAPGLSTSPAGVDVPESFAEHAHVWNGTLHPCWQRLQLPSGLPFYHNWVTGALQSEPPLPGARLLGGALCDEMGLGKTVVALALILKNPPPPQRLEGPGGAAARPVGRTLIAATPALMGQWVNEVKQHAPSLKVVVYAGLDALRGNDGDEEEGDKKRRKLSPKKMSREQKFKAAQERWETERAILDASKEPAEDQTDEALVEAELERLSAADIVLVPYPVLSREVHRARQAAGGERALRRPKRYRAADSPLTRLTWWRAMLDEAQNVGTGFSQVGDMAAMLRARSRWVVTGTPIGRGGLGDLHGLLRVLRHDPLSERALWDACVQRPVLRDEPRALARLEAVLKPIMWRNSKASVGSELLLPPRTLERVQVHFTAPERHFYKQVQEEAAVPAREALMQNEAAPAPAGAEEEAGPSTPRAGGQQQRGRKAEAAAARAEAAAGSAVLQLRKCCDHPQLTAFWQRHTAELQAHHGMLSTAEQSGRLADFLQNKLQASERDLCVLLNTLAALLLGQAPAAEPPTPSSAKGKGKAKAKAKHKPAAADGEGSEPSSPKAGHKRKGGDKRDGLAGLSADEARRAAVQLLRKSRLISENGIGAVWGQPQEDIIAADAAIRAWRPIQASVLEMLADVLEAPASRAIARLADEDLPAMRAEAARKLEELVEVPVRTMEEREARLADAAVRAREAAQRAEQLWADALQVGWNSGFCASVETVSRWHVDVLHRFEAACKREVDNASFAALARGTSVADVLRPEEERIIEARGLLEALTVPPMLGATLASLRSALDAMTGPLPQQHALGGFLEEPADQRLLQLAFDPCRTDTARQLAHALRREHGPGTYIYSQTCTLLRRAFNAAKREHDKALSRRQQPGFPRELLGASVAAAVPALEAIAAQLDFVRALRERHNAEHMLAVWRHNVDEGRQKVREDMLAVSGNAAGRTLGALQRDIETLELKCQEQLGQERYLRSQSGLPEDPDMAEDFTGGLHRAAGASEAEARPPAGSWQAGVRAHTGLSAALGVWAAPAAWPRRADDTSPAACGKTVQQGTTADAPATSAQPDEQLSPAQAGPSGLPCSASNPPPEQLAVINAVQAQSSSGAMAGIKRSPVGEARGEQEQLLACMHQDCEAGTAAQDRETEASLSQGGERLAAASAAGDASAEERQPWTEQTGDPAAASEQNNLVAGSAAEQEEKAGETLCSICYNVMDIAMLLPCGHKTCEACCKQQQVKKTCFTCRKPFTTAFRCPVQRQRHQAAGEDPKYSQVNINGQAGSKIDALLRRLVWLREHHPEIKSLVFSQWRDALLLVSKALDVQAPPIRHVALPPIRGKSQGPREAIRQFQADPDVRVFLLTRGQGAAGLTLTQASVVFLLEPSVSVAVEQQALARVHRFGQTRPVRIVRLICDATVEEEVVREAESRHALLAEAPAAAQARTNAECVTSGQVRRLLDAALRQRAASPERECQPGPSGAPR